MRVLIIDDNPIDIEMVSRMLQKRRGAVVESVHTAEEGLRRLNVETFDVVLVDYCLPGQNGVEFLEEVRRNDIVTPVLLVTARGDSNIQEIARRAGASDYISKDESLTPALYRAVEAAAARGNARLATRDRERADEMRHEAEVKISVLEERLESLERLIGNTGVATERPMIETLSPERREETVSNLTRHYGETLMLWTGTQEQGLRARQSLSELVAEMFQLGFSGEQLLSLHTASLHTLREIQGHTRDHARGCTPKMLLLETGLSLLDAYRRASFCQSK